MFFVFSGPQGFAFPLRFIRYFDMAECHVIYSENLMLFDHFGGILRFGLENHQSSTGFIRYFDVLFWMLQNVVLLTVYCCFAKSENAINF